MYANDDVGESNHAVQIREGVKLRLACYVNGNPVPEITLSKGTGDSGILQRDTNVWLNHTLNSSQCSDIGTYKCTGISTVFTKREKTFGINVTCELYITNYFLKETKDLKLMRQNCQIFELTTKFITFAELNKLNNLVGFWTRL